MTRRAVCIGAGGHAAVVLEAVGEFADVEVIGLVDSDRKLWGRDVLGFPVVGGDDRLTALRAEGVSYAVMGIGSGKSCDARARAWSAVHGFGFRFLDVIHSRAWLARSATHGEGVVALVSSVIHTRARLGVNVLINTAACVEHDCTIGDHCHVATGAIVAGGVTIGARSHIGAGSVIRHGINIGSDAVIGAGAVVVKDVEDGTTVVGNPARVLTTNTSRERG
jgi:sugar O-acyltransferase (sialic acid O-acetyltransferase NeuD family)